MKYLILLFGLVSFSHISFSDTQVFPSGLMKEFNGIAKISKNARSTREIAAVYLQETFPSLGEKFGWAPLDEINDKTHSHFTFQWQYEGRPVLDRIAKVHVSRTGDVEMASNNLAAPFTLELNKANTVRQAEFWKKKIYSDWKTKLGQFVGRVQVDPVIWVDPQSHLGFPAFDVRVIIDHPWTIRHYIIHEESGKIFETKQVARKASATVKAYKKSPFPHATPAAATSVTLSDLVNSTSLRNSFMWVRREKISGSSTTSVEVVPQDYTGATGYKSSPTPGDYSYACTDDTTCAGNMQFDAVNAYYHLSSYRTRINTYLTQLGAAVLFPYDAPVNSSTGTTNTFSVLINPVSLDFGNAGLQDDVNNAMYVGEPCRSDGSMERCLVFLRPANLSTADATANCAKSSATFYDLAREAIVVAHEYQHYVTDTITHIAFSASSSPKVGDALHEAYSDYLAASYVSDLNGVDVTLVGEYALWDCTPLQRQLNTLRPFVDSDTSNSDPHTAGISWASAFWKLRTEYGMAIADLLAIKSLFFLSSNPGFVESIEAVVKADQAVYQGAHVDRIRQIFYDEVKFVGTAQVGTGGIAEVGFKGCAAAHHSSKPDTRGIILMLSWILLTVGLGRFCRKGQV